MTFLDDRYPHLLFCPVCCFENYSKHMLPSSSALTLSKTKLHMVTFVATDPQNRTTHSKHNHSKHRTCSNYSQAQPLHLCSIIVPFHPVKIMLLLNPIRVSMDRQDSTSPKVCAWNRQAHARLWSRARGWSRGRRLRGKLFLPVPVLLNLTCQQHRRRPCFKLSLVSHCN